MSKFCVQCGNELLEKSAFCVHCGAKSNQSASIPDTVKASPQPATPPVTKAKMSGAKKIVIAVGVLIVLGGLCLGGLAYAGYRRITALSDNAKDQSSLGSIASSLVKEAASAAESKDDGPSASHQDACSLVTKEEVAEATGTSVANATSNEDKDLCTYTPTDGDMAVVTVQVNWHGGKIAMHALPGITQSAIGQDIRQPVSGIGDEAYILGVDEKTQNGFDQIPEQYKALASFATGPLMFRKGDAWVTVTATFAQNKADAEKKIASLAVSRI